MIVFNGMDLIILAVGAVFLAICGIILYYDEFDPIDEPKRTNADRIRGMDIEELANFIVHRDCCPGYVTETFSDENRIKYGFDGLSERCDYGDECHECWIDWLRQEVKE